MNSPKLYMIQNELSGKWFNARDRYFTNTLYLGTFATNELEATKILRYNKLQDGCKIIQITEDEFMQSLASKTTELVIICDSLQKKMEEIRYNLPTVSQVNKNLGNYLKNTSNKLKSISGSYFKEFVENKEDATFDVLGAYEDFILHLSMTDMYQIGEITEILKAYQKSPQSLIGIANKVNNK